jgi:hypothetical protein
LDQNTLSCLLDAATNIDVSHHLNDPTFLATLKEVEGNFKVEKSCQLAARGLGLRIKRWESFKRALSGSLSDAGEALGLLREVIGDEQALGNWLESMLLHQDLSGHLQSYFDSEGPIIPPNPQFHTSSPTSITSHIELLAVIKALVGVASVLAALAWSDEIRCDPSRERALSVLHLWQHTDGYREVSEYKAHRHS